MADDLQAGRLLIPGNEIEETFHTWGGPGGQHANRSETAVRLRFRISESSLPPDVKELLISRLGDMVEVTAAEERSQRRNRDRARRRLAARIEKALEPRRKRKKTRRTRASQERRLEQKRERSERKRLRRRPEEGK